ncbi:restriction endonuclease subunit S [Clostridium perfringens]|nr:restriction endonuclease subunit S [Clostridium perfringens]
MTYRKHKTYKDSNIDEFGEIPYHWDISKVKYELKNLDSMRIPLSSEVRGNIEKIYDYYGASGVIDKVDNYIFDEELILIGEDGANLLTRSTPLAFIAKGKFWVNNHAHILKPINNNIIYLANQLELRDYTTLVTGSAQPKLTQENLGDLTLIKPPIEEQEIIARFLSKKTLEIDALIEEKRKLIELLKEKRKAIITEAITKGINKNVEMKYSGVEWIGNIPESFNKSKLKYLTNQIIDGTHNTPNYLDEGVPFLRVTDITSSQNNEIDLESVKFISYEEHKELIKRCKPEKGDLLVSKNGTIGIPRVVDWDYEFSIFVSLCLLKLKKDKIIPEYLSYFFNSDLVDTQIAYGGKKSTIVNLHLDKMREFIIFIPNIEEQIKIVNYLDEKVNNFDDLISQCKDECIILKEYKKSLITEAVTGKIDVRNKV